jgi:hypothetical protein
MVRRLTISSLLLVLVLGAGSTLAAEEELPATGAFEPAGSLAQARIYHTATLLPDGRVLVVGDRSINDFPTLVDSTLARAASTSGCASESASFRWVPPMPGGLVS